MSTLNATSPVTPSALLDPSAADSAASGAHQELLAILASRRQVYETEPPRILEDFRNEESTTASYNGRQLLELLQNADDAARHQPIGPRRLLLRLTERELLAANTGAPFSAKGIRSVLFANLSAKYGEPGYIGAKGLGFRALLNWSPRIRIDSGPLHVAFAPEIAYAFLDELRAACPEVARTLADEPEPYPVAVLRCPRPIECPGPARPGTEGYDTVITLELPDTLSLVAHIQARLAELTAEVLIFLQYLDEVVIESLGVTRTLRCAGRGTPTLRVAENETVREWQLFERQAHFADVIYPLRAAWNADWAAAGRASWLHVFFPTRVAVPFPLLLHGPFEVSSNRDFLLNDPAGRNRYLLGELAALLVQVAEALRDQGPADAFGPLRLVWDRGRPLQHGQEAGFDFAAELRRHLLPAALLPRLDGSFGTRADTPETVLPFARYLPAAVCPSLLAYPPAEVSRAALDGVLGLLGRPPRLPLPALLAAVAAARPLLLPPAYAQLLMLLTQQLRAERLATDGLLPALFTGSEGEALLAASASPVFLPSDESAAAGDAPAAPVRVLALAQAQALREAFKVATLAELAGQLAVLHVRPYSFVELLRALVQQQRAGPPAQLHRQLFSFFRAERRRTRPQPVAERPADLAVPLPALGRGSRPGPLRAGHELYFGEAYGRPLCEALYHYDKGSKLVAGPTALGLEREDAGEVLAYLRWCGVAEEPRLLQRLLTDDERRAYPEYVLRRFDYRHSLDGERPRGFAELRDFHSVECQVTTLDDLPRLLQRSRRLLVVLEWVQQSALVSARLAAGREPATSSLAIKYGSLYKHRRVLGPQMSSFLAWQFATIPWLQVEGQAQRVAPAHTVLSPTIGPEFRPHLFRLPFRETRLPAGSQVFASYAAYKQALLRVGLRETIESVDVATIYRVLDLLPTLDPEGRAATSIYAELAENFTWRPEYAEHDSYARFCRQGKVWCRSAAGEGYHPVAGAHYLATQEMAPVLRGLFKLLALAPGYESGKVQALLGVAPLPPPVLHLAAPPRPHPLQAEFDEDWQHLRLYLYAFRQRKSSREDSLRRLRELRVRLCLTLPAEYEGESGRVPLSLPAHSFLFPGKGNRREAWLLVPAATTSLTQLQQEPDAVEAVAQLVCVALDATADKAHYELLFTASPARRDGILRNKLPGLEAAGGLEEARRQLSSSVPPAQAFWQQLAHATGSRRRELLPDTAGAWQAWLQARFPAAAPLLPAVVEDPDWEALPTAAGLPADDLALLWRLFAALALEPARFAKAGRVTLHFSAYFEREYEQLRSTHRPAFEAALQASLAEVGLSAQQRYLTTVEKFLGYVPTEAASLRQPPAQLWATAVAREFELPIDWLDYRPSASPRYEANRAQLLAYAAEESIPAAYVSSFLQSDSRHRSLLYFSQLAWLCDALRAGYQPPPVTPGANPAASDQVVELGAHTYRFSSWRDLREQLVTEPLPAGDIALLKPRRPPATGEPGATRPAGGRAGRVATVWADKNGQTGLLGELFAYWRLCQQHGAENVAWVSGNALAVGVILETEADDAAGYDLRYRLGPKAPWRWVEVKSGWEPQPLTDFYLSAGELAAGQRWGRDYELLLVSGVRRGPAGASFARIEAPFLFKGNITFLDNPYFEVATRSYHLRFRI